MYAFFHNRFPSILLNLFSDDSSSDLFFFQENSLHPPTLKLPRRLFFPVRANYALPTSYEKENRIIENDSSCVL